MNLTRRLDKIQAAMKADPREKPNLVYRLSDWAEGCPIAFQPWEAEELNSRFKTVALDNLVAAGRIRECDRGRVTFIVRVLCYPPEREGIADDYTHLRPLLREWEARERSE